MINTETQATLGTIHRMKTKTTNNKTTQNQFYDIIQ
jgi:hypothetical protein